MPLRVEPQCSICALIVGGDTDLEKRINRCRLFVPTGETLKSIYVDYATKIGYKSLNNHAHKHQAPKKSVLAKRLKSAKVKEAFTEIVGADKERTVKIYSGQADARKELLQKGMDALDRGDLKMTMNAIVTLLGQEQKAEENAKDRSVAMMKMFNYFASGSSLLQPPEPVEGEVVG